MKYIFKLLFTLSLLAVAACESAEQMTPFNGIGSAPEKISNQPLQGTMNGRPWAMTSALGQIQNDGMLLISISGNGEVLNCRYNTPLTPALLFSVPMEVANHKFDMLRPNEGYAVTWVYRDSNSTIQNVFSDMANISITSVGATRVQGGLSAKFLDPSNSGKINGSFEITICP